MSHNRYNPDRSRAQTHALLLFVFAALIGFMPIPADPDLWFHLATGREILQTAQIPRSDPFSFTCPGQPWVPHSWLFDVGVTLLWNSLGARATEAAMALVFAAAIMLVYATLRRRGVDPLVGVVIAAAIAIGAGNTRGVRPQVCSLLLTALLLWRLVRHERRPSGVLAAFVAPLFLLWAQLHSACVMGVLVLGVWTGARFWDVLWQQNWPQRACELRALCGALAVAAVAVLATPHVMTHYSYLALTMKLDYLRTFVAEWQPPRALALETPDVYLYVLLIAVLAALARRGRRVGWAELGVFGCLVVLAFSGARHIPLACIGAAPLLAQLFGRAPDRVLHAPRLAPAALAVACVALGACFAVFWQLPESTAQRYARAEPRHGAAALAALAPPGAPLNVFTTYNTGAYVLWSAPGRLRVCVDSRADVYGDAVLMRAHRALRGENWEQFFGAYDIGAAVMAPTDPLARILHERADWIILAEDPAQQTFIRAAVNAARRNAIDRNLVRALR